MENEKKLRYTESYFEGTLTNTRYSTLRNKLIFSLGGDEMAKTMTDILIYLMSVKKQQWEKNQEMMLKYDEYFLQNCSQIEHNLFLSSHHRRLGMEGLKNLGLIDYSVKGREKIYKVKVLTDKVIDLVEEKDKEFNSYHLDFQETERQRYEEKKDRQLEVKEKWEEVNRWKYSDIWTFKEKMSVYDDLDEFDLKIIAYISKGLWKHKKKVVEWTEQDLNHIRSLICEDYKKGRTKEEQEKLFHTLGGNYQRVVDTCKCDEHRYKGVKSWSMVYDYLYKENTTDKENIPYRYNKEWKIDDLEYYKSDISNEVFHSYQ